MFRFTVFIYRITIIALFALSVIYIVLILVWIATAEWFSWNVMALWLSWITMALWLSRNWSGWVSCELVCLRIIDFEIISKLITSFLLLVVNFFSSSIISHICRVCWGEIFAISKKIWKCILSFFLYILKKHWFWLFVPDAYFRHKSTISLMVLAFIFRAGMLVRSLRRFSSLRILIFIVVEMRFQLCCFYLVIFLLMC